MVRRSLNECFRSCSFVSLSNFLPLLFRFVDQALTAGFHLHVLDFISKDYPLVFGQSHVTQCRERIALSILNGRAIM
jgi:hypothetical protein